MSSFHFPAEGSPLHEAYLAVRAAQPGITLAEMSALLKVTEADLLLESDARVYPLHGSWQHIMNVLPSLGRITFVTSNAVSSQEQTSAVEAVFIGQQEARLIGPGLDLQLQLKHWQHAYYVQGAVARPYQHGLFFFDRTGICRHRMLLMDDAPGERHEAMLGQLPCEYRLSQAKAKIPVRSLHEFSAVQRKAFIADWSVMQDMNDFRALTWQYGVSPLQALRLLAPVYSHRVDSQSIMQLLQALAEARLRLSIATHGHGVIQTYRGPVARFCSQRQRSSAAQHDFRLLLSREVHHEAWVVRRPIAAGIRTTLEIFDGAGDLALQLADASDPRGAETEDWQDLLEDLPVITAKT